MGETPWEKKLREAEEYISNDIKSLLCIPDDVWEERGLGKTVAMMDRNGVTNRDYWREVWCSCGDASKLKFQPDSEREKWANVQWPTNTNPIHETIEKLIKESEKEMNTRDFANAKVVIGDKVIIPRNIDVKVGWSHADNGEIHIVCDIPKPSTISYAEYAKMYKGNKVVKGYYATIPEIERVIFNDPATIVIWADGSKTVVKAQPGDAYNPEVGVVMCIAKKVYGNGNKFNDIIRECFIKKIQADSIISRRQAKALYRAATNADDAKVEEITTAAARTNVNNAYDALTKVFNKKRVTKSELIEAMEAAIGDLGEVLDS